MDHRKPQAEVSADDYRHRQIWRWLFVALFGLILISAFLRSQHRDDPALAQEATDPPHDTVAAANLLAAHSYTAEAEGAYQLAAQLWPGNPESINGLAELLASNGKANDARQLLDDFARKYPDQRKFLEQSSAAMRIIWTANSKP
jgi:hypothetical protein